MSTMVLDVNDRLFFAAQARVVRDVNDVPADIASSAVAWDIEKANPYLKWVAGSYVASDMANSNKQFWTAQDLELGEYSIRYAPLNINHRVRQPVGFYLATRKVFYDGSTRAQSASQAPFRIEALAGMWSHVFPFESALVDQADEKGLLYYSMECVAESVTCAGDQGCGETFDYFKPSDHCAHIKERASVRHLVNPTFRGGALIIPPTQPGWKDANAGVYQAAVREEAERYAMATESAYYEATKSSDMTVSDWESLMATIVSLA